MTDSLDRALATAIELARQSGPPILDVYHKDFSVDYHADQSPVTEADRRANAIIVQGLSRRFPGHAVLSEEQKDDRSRLGQDWCWVVDPLDGTKEFVQRRDEFTVNIALTYQQEPVVGVILVPVTGELYFAARGMGAFLDAPDGPIRLRVSERTENLRAVMSRSHGSEALKRALAAGGVTALRQAGSSLKGCLVARGEAEIYYRTGPTMEWDTCAMHCIVEEAGGIVRQLDESPLYYNRADSKNHRGFYMINCWANRLQWEE